MSQIFDVFFKVFKELCNINLIQTAQEIYKNSTCEKIELIHAHVLNRLADTINDVAEHDVILRFVVLPLPLRKRMQRYCKTMSLFKPMISLIRTNYFPRPYLMMQK